MLSLDTIFVPGGGRNFLRPQECISRSPENIRDEMQRGRIFCSLRVFSHTVVHNVWKIFSDPQNEHPGEWKPPRPLHALLRANWALTRPISESCWWSGTRSALKAPVQRRAVPGEGRASVSIFFDQRRSGPRQTLLGRSREGSEIGGSWATGAPHSGPNSRFCARMHFEDDFGKSISKSITVGMGENFFAPIGTPRQYVVTRPL